MDDDSKKLFKLNRYNTEKKYYSTRSINDINKARLLIGLDPIKNKKRKCMNCKNDIYNVHDRLCLNCQNNANNSSSSFDQ